MISDPRRTLQNCPLGSTYRAVRMSESTMKAGSFASIESPRRLGRIEQLIDNTTVIGNFQWKFRDPNPGCRRENERRGIIETTNGKLPKSFIAKRSQGGCFRVWVQRMVVLASYIICHACCRGVRII